MVAPLALFLASLAGGSLMERNRNKKRAEAEKQDQAMVDRNLDLAINPDMVKSNGINLDVSGLQGPMQFQRRAAGGPSDMGRVERFANTTLPINAQSAPRLGQEQRQIGALQNMSRMKSLTPAQGAVNDFALQQVMKPESESKRFVREIYGQEQAVNPILGRSMPHADGLRGSAPMNSPQGRQAMLQRRTLEALPIGEAASLVAKQVFPEVPQTPDGDVIGLMVPGERKPRYLRKGDPLVDRMLASGAVPYEDTAPGLEVLFDEETGQEQKARWDASKGEYVRVGGLKQSGPKTYTADQYKSAGFGTRMMNAKSILNEIERDPNFDPAAYMPQFMGGVPIIGNKLIDDNRQRYNQAQENWVTANLRKESGAVIGADEMQQEIKKYFPIAGDGPGVIAQKSMARQDAERAMLFSSGGAYQDMNQGEVTGGREYVGFTPEGNRVFVENGQQYVED